MRGGQWQVLRLMEQLAQAGHQPVLLARRHSPLLDLAAERALDAKPIGIGMLAREAKSADLVHVHDGRSHTLAAALQRKPLVVSRRVAFPVQDNAVSRWKYSRARHFIAVSEHVKRMLIQARVPEKKISVVYDGVPEAAPVEGGRLILAPATDDPAKGSALVAEAAQLAGLEIKFSSNLEADLRDALLFIYITRREGLGSGALMAMAAGIPVVASRVGGLVEVIEDGESGLLVENDPVAIERAMRRLCGDADLRRRLGACARQRVRERFSVAAMVRGTLDVYHRVLTC